MTDFIVTYTISIDRAGNVYNDTQTHGSAFADVYRAFHAIKVEVDRQIVERRNCPYNPAHIRAHGEPFAARAVADRLASGNPASAVSQNGE